jgi:hypothetical protein
MTVLVTIALIFDDTSLFLAGGRTISEEHCHRRKTKTKKSPSGLVNAISVKRTIDNMCALLFLSSIM